MEEEQSRIHCTDTNGVEAQNTILERNVWSTKGLRAERRPRGRHEATATNGVLRCSEGGGPHHDEHGVRDGERPLLEAHAEGQTPHLSI